MLVAIAIGLGIVTGWASGGTLTALIDSEIRGARVLVVTLVVHVVTTIVGTSTPQLAPFVIPVWVLTLGVTAYIALRNRSSAGFPAVLTGSLLNLIVVLANRGMPVSAAAAELALGDGALVATALQDPDGLHVAMTEASRLMILADVAIVPGPEWLRMAVSLGDVLVVVGVAAIVAHAMTMEPSG